jgi:hypothetical protein
MPIDLCFGKEKILKLVYGCAKAMNPSSEHRRTGPALVQDHAEAFESATLAASSLIH